MPWKFITPNIECEVKYKKAPNKLLAPPPKIIMRTEDGLLVTQVRVVADKKFMWKGRELATETKFIDPETGKQVSSSEVTEALEHYKYKLFNENGEEVEKDDLFHFEVQEDGSESGVKPFDRSNVIDISEENWVPSTCIDEFLILSVYEIFSDKKAVIRELFKEAETRLKKDQIGIATWSWGGFKQIYAFVCPYMKEGEFGWLVKFSDTQPELVHSQEIPTKAKVPIREVPTLKSLPPVQALVVAAKRKK